MNRIISVTLLFFFLMIIITGCDITQLVTEDKQTKEEVSGEEGGNKNITVFENGGLLSQTGEIEEDFINLIKTNGDTKYEIKNMEGYYSIGPLEGHLINIKWDSSNSVIFRTDNSEKVRISKGVIEESGVKVNDLIEAPTKGIYINDTLKDGKGLIFISWMNEKNFFWYKNNQIKEYKNIQFYFLSPLQKYIVLFSGDYKTSPLLIEIDSGKEINLPIEVDHGWPEYSVGMSFSADETKLLYEDWSSMELCIYGIKEQKELYRIGEKEYSLTEASLSPNGKMAAYLKYDNSQKSIDLREGRDPIGHRLIVYDLEKKKVVKEIIGEYLMYLKPIWSTDGKYLIFNTIEIQNEKEVKLIGNPKLLNIGTGKTTNLTNNEEVLKYALAWSEDNKKVIVSSKSIGNLNRLSAININLVDELDIDYNKYYISMLKKSGTDVYEIISIDNSKLTQFKNKIDVILSPDEKYIGFGVIIDGNEYLILAPRQEIK